MTKKERKLLASDIDNRLENELDFQLNYEMSDFHKDGVSIINIDLSPQYSDNYIEGWEKKVEDIFVSVIKDWGGWYSWEGMCISVNILDKNIAIRL